MQQRRPDEAAQLYTRIADIDRSDIEALNFLAARALAMSHAAEALQWFERLREASPGEANATLGLGRGLAMQGKLSEARALLEEGLVQLPQAFMARFALGEVLQRLGDSNAAVLQYYRAILQAQRQGRWLNDATTHPSMRAAVKRAMAFVVDGRLRLFQATIDPLRARYGSAELARVERCLRIYLELEQPEFPDARQRPKFMYFPDLPTAPYFPRKLFPWFDDFEARTEAIRREMQNALAADGSFEPFLGDRSDQDAESYLSGQEGKRSWNAYFFYRHGERFEDRCRRCPQTMAALETLPLVHIREHGPEICFSLLTPGSHILPHQGVTNTRAVVHLPLVVPAGCALTVGGEEHVWQEGHAIAFDDTFLHEAWNRSDSMRVIVLMDTWNPYLTEVERAAVTDLVAVIGDFNTAAEQPLIRE